MQLNDGASTSAASGSEGSDDSGSDDGGYGVGSESGAATPLCAEEDFAGGPLVGPGLDPQTGDVLDPQPTYWAHTTYLRLHDDTQSQTKFTELIGAIVPALLASEGLVGYALGSSQVCGTARTMGVWRSQEAMLAFVVSAPHATAMAVASDVGRDGVTTSWALPTDAFPLTWTHAVAALTQSQQDE